MQQLLLNYLPTSIATLIEPFWVVLNRLLCLLQPLDQLRRGNAPPSTSLNLRYSSIPPQLVFWRALHARHFLLAAVCGMAFLANILTIALSGLLTQHFVSLSNDLLLRQLHLVATKPNSTWMNAGITMDNFYIADANITAGSPLPPWVTPDYYLVPFELPPSADQATRYRAITTGVRAEFQCEELHNSQGQNLFNFTLNSDATGAAITISHYQPDGGMLRCQTDVGWGGNPEGINAAEVLHLVAASNPTGSSAESAFCRAQIVAGWIRSNITLEAPSSNNTVLGSARRTTSVVMNHMFMICKPRVSNTSFEVTVDSSGRVLDSRSIDPIPSTTNVTALFSVSDDIITAILHTGTNRGMVWHNDTVAADWPNYLIKQLTHSPAILDPHAPVPLFDPTAALFSSVYSRTFLPSSSASTQFGPFPLSLHPQTPPPPPFRQKQSRASGASS